MTGLSPSRRARRALLVPVALLALTLCGYFAPPARAGCFAVTDPEFVALDPLVARNATLTLAKVRARLALAPRDDSPADQRRRAALYAVEADAYQILELNHKARAAAERGLRIATAPTDPLHLELLRADALDIYTTAGIRAAIARIEAARAQQLPGSRSSLCLEITLGILQLYSDQYAHATRTLTRAYAESGKPAWGVARAEAAWALSAALRNAGDFQEALTLIRQKMAWDASHGDALALSVSTYLEAEIINAMRHFHRAIAIFERARDISVGLGDHQGIAFADMRICQSLIQLGQYAAARPHCGNAARVFAAARSTDVLKEADEYLARIDLVQGHPGRALAILDFVLDRGGADMAPASTSTAYRTRARVFAALHRYGPAYADLSQYLRRYRAESLARRVRMQHSIRERLLTEQEIARNAILRRQLELTRERAERQKEQLRWGAAASVAALLLIALLSYILTTSLRHRRELLRLAAEDSLTGLPNRGRTFEMATAALEHALASGRLLTVAIIDLDHFKTINDRCGHAAGDSVLREFARLSRGSLRTDDILGRWGGEEFLLVLPDTSLDAALASIERLRALALGIAVPAPDDPLRVTFSAGLATTADGVRSLDEIIARADAALYEAKNGGRDLVRIDRDSYESASTGVRRALRLR